MVPLRLCRVSLPHPPFTVYAANVTVHSRGSHANLGKGLSKGSDCVCVHVQVPALRLGTKRPVPPRGAGAVGHCPSGHSGQDRCYLSAVSEKDRGTHSSRCSEPEFSDVMYN